MGRKAAEFEAGERVGRWTVLERDATSREHGAVFWIVRCGCGVEKSVRGDSLRRGQSTQCLGCTKGLPIEIGQTFGLRTVISLDLSGRFPSSARRWLVRCVCGTEDSVIARLLVGGFADTCRACRDQPRLRHVNGEVVPGWYVGRAYHGAQTRNLVFEITAADLDDLWRSQKGQCALSGALLEFGPQDEQAKTTASLDRIDSSKGYIPGNLQWIHKRVNMAKKTLTNEQFISLCQEVAVWAQ